MDDDNTQLFRGKSFFSNNNDLCNKFYVQNAEMFVVMKCKTFIDHMKKLNVFYFEFLIAGTK